MSEATSLFRGRPATGSRPPEPGGEPVLVGREEEIGILESVLADPGAPGVLLSGPPGVGRTRLLHEALRLGGRVGLHSFRITGSSAVEGIPLGALAHVLPPVPGEPNGFALLQHALTALRGDGDRSLVAVDDAHLLDELTVAVLQQLVLGDDAVVVATEPSGRCPSDPGSAGPVRVLRDEMRRVTVAPLAGRQADRLLAAMLDGDVEARTAQRLTTAARGRPAFLSELLRAGREAGRLARHDGLWRWDGGMEPPSGSQELPADPPDVAPAPQARPEGVGDAARANRELDHPRAERIAGALVVDDPDGAAHLELVEALRWQDRGDELDPLLDGAGRRVRTDDGRARIALTRALLARRRGRPASQPGPDTTAAGPAHAAVRETAARLDGRGLPAGPAGGAGPAAGDLPVEGTWAALAGAARAGRLAAAGRTGEALDVVARVREVLDGRDDQTEAALAGLLLVDAELSALRVAGRGDDAERVAEEAHRRNLAGTEWAGDDWIAWHRGRAALVRGDLAEAAHRLTEARSGTARRDPLALAADCAGVLALVHVLSGSPGRARAVLAEAPADPPATARPALARARVWLDAADRPGAPPVQPLLEAGRAAADRGDRTAEIVVLHDAARLGRADLVAERLATLARRTGTPLAGLYAAHAAAARDGAASRLDRVAADLAAAGARPDAADVAAAAVAAHQPSGDRRRSALSAAHALRLADECGGLRTPALSRIDQPRLTAREREIAELVAGGASNAEVSRRLVLSVRTVETHLAHAYAKLGIEGRADLGAALLRVRPIDGRGHRR